MEIEIISTKLPHSKIISHSWSKEAQEKTTYLFPPTQYFWGMIVELLSCGLRGWFKCFRLPNRQVFPDSFLDLREHAECVFLVRPFGSSVSHLAVGWRNRDCFRR